MGSLLFQAQTPVYSVLPQTQPRELTPTCLKGASKEERVKVKGLTPECHEVDQAGWLTWQD